MRKIVWMSFVRYKTHTQSKTIICYNKQDGKWL